MAEEACSPHWRTGSKEKGGSPNVLSKGTASVTYFIVFLLKCTFLVLFGYSPVPLFMFKQNVSNHCYSFTELGVPLTYPMLCGGGGCVCWGNVCTDYTFLYFLPLQDDQGSSLILNIVYHSSKISQPFPQGALVPFIVQWY